jgi:hypothetical protein
MFAVLGSIGFEAVYVSVVIWSSERPNKWVWFTSVAALLFSSGIALRVYWQQDGWWSLLHLGYPVISYFYSLTVHSDGEQKSVETAEASDEAEASEEPVRLEEPVEPGVDSQTTKVLRVFQETQDLGKTAMKVGIKKDVVQQILAAADQ